MSKGKIIHLGDYCLTMEFINLVDQFSWLCTSMYDPNVKHIKPIFFKRKLELSMLRSISHRLYVKTSK